MIRTPQMDWHWCFNTAQDKLVLADDADTVLTSAYSSKQLIVKPGFNEAFNLAQSEAYHELADIVSQCVKNVPEPVLFQIVVHAIAANTFHKSVANKSWLFIPADAALHTTPLVFLHSQTDRGLALVLEKSAGFATLLLLSAALAVPEQKSFARYHVIKTNINTLNSAVGDDLITYL
ncbi:cell division protein ZapC domain-containing protein [Alteromonas sp. a30]|uniref:cell division protein ZapC domain-containing protein n=1 Tax=Alteromonas sp. a30 TaxID=2730917 RepID=UPI002281F90C|nr:cell division protein ZapC domain-containing protein [Alteromonas sp. a30]MCY7293901.1 hypothetical protein [Alteromonas sp. a30]